MGRARLMCEDNVPIPPPDLGFGALLDWHLRHATRSPNSGLRGTQWGITEFANEVGVSDRQVRNWRDGKSLPRELGKIEEKLFGRDPKHRIKDRQQLRQAFEAAREQERKIPPAFPTARGIPSERLKIGFGGRASGRLLAAAAALGLVLIAILLWEILPRLTISETKVFDSSFRTLVPDNGGMAKTLTELHQTSKSITVGAAEEFLLPFGFVISGFRRAADGSINLHIHLIGRTGTGEEAWHSDGDFTSVDDWMQTLIPKSVGASTVLKEFGIDGRTAIPSVWAVQCAEADELAKWDGEVDILVIDKLSSGASAQDQLIFNIHRLPQSQSGETPSNCHK
jgi:hypothetical protein